LPEINTKDKYNYCVFGHYASSCFLFETQHFGDWILFPSSGKKKILLSWAQSTQLVPISGHQHQHMTGSINQPQHKPSARVNTDIKNIKKTPHTRLSTYVHALLNGQCL
jgi:hypothetical protein